jgi:3-oxoacyl-[acyl-carrier-protein] synthase III
MQLVDVAHSLERASYPDLEELRTEYGWSDRNHRIFSRMFGLQSAARHPGVALADLLAGSAVDLAKRNPELIEHVDQVYYCHAVNDTLPFDHDLLGQLVRKIFACDPEVMSVAHGSCTSAIMVLRTLQAFPDDRPMNVVILTGEKCFFDMLQYADNQGLYGEAASATFVRLGDTAGTQVVATATGVFDGLFAPMVNAPKEVTQAFDQAFLPRMSGLVQRLLQSADIAPHDIDLIFPTHLSPFTSDRVANLVGMPRAQIWKANLPRIGHCYCGDLFLNYQSWLTGGGDKTSPVNILSVASGMTGSYAGIVLRRS